MNAAATSTPATSTRFIVLTIETELRTMRGAIKAEQLEAAQKAARALADVGHKVSLRWETSPAAGDDTLTRALMAATAFGAGGRAVAYRLIRTEEGAEVVWLIMETEAGRGYGLAFNRAWTKCDNLFGGPVRGKYMWGLKRLQGCPVAPGATITQDWTAL